MKKTILFIFIALLFSACDESQSSKYMGLKGHIEFVKDFQYETNDKFGSIEAGSLIKCTTYTFNSNGDLTNTSIYDNSGSCVGSIENVYDGDMLSKIIFDSSYISNLIETKEDTTIWEINMGEETIRTEQIKNEKYFCTVIEQGYSIQKDEQWLDKNGNSIEHKVTEESSAAAAATEEDNIILWSKSQYKDGDVIRTEYLKGQNIGIDTYSYSDHDDKGNWIKRTIYHNGKPLYIEEREIKYVK